MRLTAVRCGAGADGVHARVTSRSPGLHRQSVLSWRCSNPSDCTGCDNGYCRPCSASVSAESRRPAFKQSNDATLNPESNISCFTDSRSSLRSI